MKKYLIPILSFLGLIVFCSVAVLFKVFSLEELPASFIGAALGAIITGVVTTILLKAQSQAEEIKERNAKVFEQKSVIFQKYIKNVWKIWEDHKVTAEEFQRLTSDYYSNLMIYLCDDSINKISDCLSNISDCIDKEDVNHEVLRENVINIINILSSEIKLGGGINIEKVKELDSKMFPVLFKKTIISEFKSKMMEESGLFLEPQLVKAYSKNNEYLQFVFKEYPDCKVSIGPFDVVGQLKVGLDINKKLHQFDKYRSTIKKFRYWIITNRNDTKRELFLNEKLPHDEESEDIESGNIGKINNFGFNDTNSIRQFEGNYQKLSALLAQRAAYYLNTETINNEFSIAEFPEKMLKG
jgi:gas vesicle protein